MVILFICLETGLDSNCYSQYQTVISMWFESQIQIKLKPTPASGASSQHFDRPTVVLYIQYRGTILPPRAGRRWRGAPLDLEISSSRRAHRLRDLFCLSVVVVTNLSLLLPPLAFQTVESGGGDEQRGRHQRQKMDAAHSSSLNTSLETPSQANLRQCFPPDKAAFQCRDVIVWPSQRTRET